MKDIRKMKVESLQQVILIKKNIFYGMFMVMSRRNSVEQPYGDIFNPDSP